MKITILGSGPAGLSAGYYAKKAGVDFEIFEKNSRIGGNCITFKCGDFLLDSGAHRLHNKQKHVTDELLGLLGENLCRINIPSKIYYKGKYIDFPLSPMNLMLNLGFKKSLKSITSFVNSKLMHKASTDNFENMAVGRYGRKISEMFLLNYTRKLWGVDCCNLSTEIAGTRMKGLTLATFVKEALFGSRAKTEHLDGSFYYPKYGIGEITDNVADFCGRKNIFTDSQVTRIFRSHNNIEAVEINNSKKIYTDKVISTLPLNDFLKMMEPLPEEEILKLADGVKYRDLILAVFFLNTESVTKAATVYFPDRKFIFTRLYEPKNRSQHMSPKGCTSLVVEIPCRRGDNMWNFCEQELIETVKKQLIQAGLVSADKIIDSKIFKLENAYPILDIDSTNNARHIKAYLKKFGNLQLAGRSGKYEYSWIHNHFSESENIISQLCCGKTEGEIVRIKDVAGKGISEHVKSTKISS